MPSLKPAHSLGDNLWPLRAAAQVEPLEPPAGARPGERVFFGEGNEKQPAPAEPNRVQKKKIWEQVVVVVVADW